MLMHYFGAERSGQMPPRPEARAFIAVKRNNGQNAKAPHDVPLPHHFHNGRMIYLRYWPTGLLTRL